MLARDPFLGSFDGNSGVAAIGIRPDGLAEFVVQGRAADQNDIIVADAFLVHRVDDNLHVGHRRSQQGGHAENVGLLGFQCLQVAFHGVVNSKVHDLESRAFHHHRDKVLADIMNVAFHRANHHLADTRRAGFDQQRLEDRHAALHRVGGHQDLGHEKDTVAEVITNDGHAPHQCLGQDTVGLPLALEQDIHTFLNLFLEAVVEVVEHLRDEVLVVQFRQDNVVFLIRHGKRSC
mmetsp:Transcript_5755/g.10013  ORF Transcript_5755/g.10013 Transcript_5755/m.10013 type:complete len:234 (+) Transcript_5755:258-959(+)